MKPQHIITALLAFPAALAYPAEQCARSGAIPFQTIIDSNTAPLRPYHHIAVTSLVARSVTTEVLMLLTNSPDANEVTANPNSILTAAYCASGNRHRLRVESATGPTRSECEITAFNGRTLFSLSERSSTLVITTNLTRRASGPLGTLAASILLPYLFLVEDNGPVPRLTPTFAEIRDAVVWSNALTRAARSKAGISAATQDAAVFVFPMLSGASCFVTFSTNPPHIYIPETLQYYAARSNLTFSLKVLEWHPNTPFPKRIECEEYFPTVSGGFIKVFTTKHECGLPSACTVEDDVFEIDPGVAAKIVDSDAGVELMVPR